MISRIRAPVSLGVFVLLVSQSQASPVFTINDLGPANSSPTIPASLASPRRHNSSGQLLVELWGNPVGQLIEDAALVSRSHSVYLSLGGPLNFAVGLNDAGQVVGSSATAGGELHAFLYTDHRTLDLNTLIPPISGWVLSSARAIDDSERILAIGTRGGPDHLLLLSPVPVPESGWMSVLGIAGAGWLARPRRRK